MKILWCSDPPVCPTAYGQQTAQLVPRIHALGHEVVIFAPSLYRAKFQWNGIQVLGGRHDPFGNDMLALHAERQNADVIITLKDPYVYHVDVLRTLPAAWVPFAPIDTEPISTLNLERLRWATRPIAISANAEVQLKAAGFDPYFIPHGIDTSFWQPMPQETARRVFSMPQDSFVALFVGANVDWPSRKNLDVILAAWAQFLKVHPDAILYLHTDLDPERPGLPLEDLLTDYGIGAPNVWTSDQYEYVNGLPDSHMRLLYNAADVLLSPTNEGFGLPVIEAQSCGTPVITSRFAALRDTTFAGSVIPSETESRAGVRVWATGGGFWFRPHVDSVVDCLEVAYAHRGESRARAVARQGVVSRFEITTIMHKYWEPALVDLEQWLLKGVLNGSKKEERQSDRYAAGESPSA